MKEWPYFKGIMIKYILSKVPLKKVEKLDISVEAEGTKPLNLTVNVDLELPQQEKKIDLKMLVDEAVKEALKASVPHLTGSAALFLTPMRIP